MLNRRSLSCLLGLAALLLAASSASAAQLSGTTSADPANVNLTLEGTLDWAIWDYQSSGTGTSGAPSNRKSGGAVIGNLSALLGTPRGITGTFGPPSYTYTNGTSPVSSTATIGGDTETTLNTVGAGFKLNITGDPLTLEVVRVYVDVFNAVGTMTATLNGASTYTDSTFTSTGLRAGGYYTFTFQPDSASDTLQLSYKVGSLNTGGNANVSLQAVSVAPVPEPGSLAMVAVGALGLGLGRRRRA